MPDCALLFSIESVDNRVNRVVPSRSFFMVISYSIAGVDRFAFGLIWKKPINETPFLDGL